MCPCPSPSGQRGTWVVIPACRVGERFIYPFRGIKGIWGMVFGVSFLLFLWKRQNTLLIEFGHSLGDSLQMVVCAIVRLVECFYP